MDFEAKSIFTMTSKHSYSKSQGSESQILIVMSMNHLLKLIYVYLFL